MKKAKYFMLDILDVIFSPYDENYYANAPCRVNLLRHGGGLNQACSYHESFSTHYSHPMEPPHKDHSASVTSFDDKNRKTSLKPHIYPVNLEEVCCIILDCLLIIESGNHFWYFFCETSNSLVYIV